MAQRVSEFHLRNGKLLIINIDLFANLPATQFVVMGRLLNAADKKGRVTVSSIQPYIVGHSITTAEGEAAFTALEHRALLRLIRKTSKYGRHYELSERIFGGFFSGEG